MTDENTAPSCPGCHFGCKLTQWQCARGRDLWKAWQENGEPARTCAGRRASGDEGPEHGRKELTLEQQFNRLVNIVPKALQRKSGSSDADTMLAAIARHGGYMASSLVRSEVRMNQDGFSRVLGELEASGDVVVEREGARTFIRLTETGEPRVSQDAENRDRAAREFLSALSDEEAQQLIGLLEKALGGQGHRKR